MTKDSGKVFTASPASISSSKSELGCRGLQKGRLYRRPRALTRKAVGAKLVISHRDSILMKNTCLDLP